MKIGDKIQCWTASECNKKMMELAARGIIADEEPKGSNKLVIKMMSEGEEDSER